MYFTRVGTDIFVLNYISQIEYRRLQERALRKVKRKPGDYKGTQHDVQPL